MPPPTQQEIAVATANYMLDNPEAGPTTTQMALGPLDDDEDENIDPQLRPSQQSGPTQSQNTQSKHEHFSNVYDL